jgi:hypothetical protein
MLTPKQTIGIPDQSSQELNPTKKVKKVTSFS